MGIDIDDRSQQMTQILTDFFVPICEIHCHRVPETQINSALLWHQLFGVEL